MGPSSIVSSLFASSFFGRFSFKQREKREREREKSLLEFARERAEIAPLGAFVRETPAKRDEAIKRCHFCVCVCVAGMD